MRIAFFDLDRTLFSVNSGVLWLRREWKAGHVTVAQAARAGVWLAGYHLGLFNLERAIERAVATLAGTEAKPIIRRTEAFYHDELRSLYRPKAHSVLSQHREAGDLCVLLTASTEYLSTLVVDELKLDGSLCNRLEVDKTGLHTGRIVGGTCFGEGKLMHAQRYAETVGANLSDCVFYTDSYSDRAVLARVGHPVAVNPDVRLLRLARRKGWRIVDWGTP